MPLLALLHRVAERNHLDAAEAEQAMSAILSGEATTPQVAGFLVALRMKGETVEELTGFARAMRARMTRVDAGEGVILDTCGTGGDGAGTFNISTVVAFVAAGAGVKVAKHGNRSISSRCGSADVLEGLGVRIALTPEQMGRSIRQIGIGFLFAPALHPAMKHAQQARVDLKMRTVFNLLGPLANPAGATAQLIGAPNAEAADLMANALAALGLERGYVVHGEGLDEVTTSGPTLVWSIAGGKVTYETWTPETFGVEPSEIGALAGADLAENVRIARAVLGGETGPARDVVLMNAAAALMAAGVASEPPAAMEVARRSIDSGAARSKLEALVAFTQSLT
jgi:anthranilate phosphoribosyltransferase